MFEILETLSNLLSQNLWLGLLIALFAGILTSFTPCSLSGVPLIAGYVSGYSRSRRQSLIFSLAFCLGMSLVFIAFGIIISAVGEFMADTEFVWNIILAVLTILLSMQTLEIIHIFPHRHVKENNGKKGVTGAFLTGAASAVMDSPCTAPALLAIIALISTGKSVIFGILMLVLFCIGHSILFIVSGLSLGFIKYISSNKKFHKAASALKITMGVLMYLLALLFVYQAFNSAA